MDALRALQILDTPPEPEYDDVARLAAAICQTPMASVTFIAETRQWFKAMVGLKSHDGGSREESFCAHVVASGTDDLFVVTDAEQDPRFSDNPHVIGEPGIRFYAGAPLVTRDGQAIGTLCVIDRRPRQLTDEQRSALSALRRYLLTALELRRMLFEQRSTIARLEQTQSELRLARSTAEAATAAQGLFFATMSHEFRTPINAVVGMTNLLRDTPLSPEQRDCVETIRTSGELLVAVVNDLLDFSKIESGHIELDEAPFDLRSLVEESVRMIAQVAREKGLSLTTDVDPGVPANVVGDATRIRQILINLLSNAVKFTERGGVNVTVSAGRKTADGRDLIRLSVRDTGIGLTSEQCARLFQVYAQADRSTTRRYGGTGLGLAISKRLTELHGGNLTVESALGAGSTFHAEFASGRMQSAPAGPIPAEPAPLFDRGFAGRHPCRLLVAEDNAINQKVVLSMLRRLGFEKVDVVADGIEAVSAVSATAYDVVLMDIDMPRLDGIGATRRIRSEVAAGRQPVIIALTAHASEEKRQELLAAGLDAFLAKPIDLALLTQLLAGWPALRAPAA